MSAKMQRRIQSPFVEEVNPVDHLVEDEEAKEDSSSSRNKQILDEEGDSVSGVSSDLLPTPPDGGWGWMVVFASFMIHIIADGITYSFGIFVVELMNVFSEGRGSVSFIPSILVGVCLGVGPFASALTNRYGCRVVTIIGAILASFGMAVSAAAPNITYLYFSIGLCTGVGFGLIYLPAIVSVSMYFERRRAFATGIAVCGSGIGTFIMAPVTRSLIDNLEWTGAFLVTGAIVFLCVFFGMLFRPLEQEDNSESSENKVLNEDQTIESYNNPDLLEGGIEVPLKNGKLTLPSLQLNGEPLRPLAYQVGNKEPEVNGFVGGHNVTVLNDSVDASSRVAMSHPVLSISKVGSSKCVKFGSHSRIYEKKFDPTSGHPHALHGHHHHHAAGVMFRKDIFYGGSLLNIPEYKKNPKRYSKQMVKEQFEKQYEIEHQHVSLHQSHSQSSFQNFVKRRKSQDAVDGSLASIASSRDQDNVCCCYNKDSSEALKTFSQMMDFSLLKNKIFIMFIISNFLTSIGFNVPYVYTVDRAILMNVEKEQASFLLSVIGIANTLGRIILGYISDRPCINRLYLYNVSLASCGIAICLSNFCLDYASQVVYCAIFGITSGAYVGLTSVVLVDLLGLDKLTNAFGLLLLFQGIASVMGPPIIGWLYDMIGNYDSGFYFAGSMIFISGAMLFFLPMMIRREKRKSLALRLSKA